MKLTAVGIKKAGDGRLGDGRGLELYKNGPTGKWIWRYSYLGKRREMGLGTWPTVSLADARQERDRWALLLAQGRDPIAERDRAKEAEREALNRVDPSLEHVAREVFGAYKGSLRKDGTSSRWMSPLVTHVFPRLGRRPISTITQHDIHDVIKPIWRTKHPTAEKAIQRLGKIFHEGRLRGYACDRFTIDAAESMLGPVVHKTQSIEATPWKDIPALYGWLDGRGTSAACLQFMILTLVRASGCRMARFDEFRGDVWTVPAERMKGKEGKVEDFKVPLAPAALQLVERRRALGGEYLFPGHRNTPLTDNALSKFMRDNNCVGKPHGFRTSFRTWVQDTDATTFDVAEMVLAHKIGDKTVRAYARSDLLDRRRSAMIAWSEFVVGPPQDRS